MRTHAISKRILSVVLALMLVLGMIPVVAMAADTTTIYFDNTAGWSTVKIYYWGNGSNPVGWPGSNMKLVDGTIYSFEVPSSCNMVIFNNGKTQTSDLAIPTNGNNLYAYNGDWSFYNPSGVCEHVWDKGSVVIAPTCTAAGESVFTCTLCSQTYNEPVAATGHSFADGACSVCGVSESLELFFENTAGWEAVNAYYWCDGGNLSSWPGEAMTNVSGNIWSYTLPGDAQYVIFNNGSGTQTSDLTIPSDKNLYVYGSDWATYDPEACYHEWNEGELVTEPTCKEEGEMFFICTLCGNGKSEKIPVSGHKYANNVCTVCGEEKVIQDLYLVGFINGADYGINEDYENLGEYKFVDGRLVATFTADSYVYVKTADNTGWYMSQAYCTEASVTLYNTITGSSEKLFVPGNVELTFQLVDNGDDTLTLSYTTATPICKHTSHNTDGICTECGETVEHSYVEGACSVCGVAAPALDFYLIGFINGVDYGCNDDYANLGEYKFVDGKLVATFSADSYVYIKTSDNAGWYMAQAYCSDASVVLYNTTTGAAEKLFVPGNVELTFQLVDNGDDTLTLSYTVTGTVCEHTKHDTNGVCVDCGKTVEHTYVDDVCTVCGAAAPVLDFYLVGYINGADYGCNDDYENMGEYKFVDGKLVATFDCDSYVFLKTTGNASWYLTEVYTTDTTATFVTSGTEKMLVPGNVEVTFTLIENEDGSVTLSYTTAIFEYTVSGNVTSYGDASDEVTIELIQGGSVIYSTVVTGKNAAYAIENVASGSYTLKISKNNHVALEIAISVDGADVAQDAKICLIGDATGDGKVNMKDWSRLYDHISETNTLSDYNLRCADANGDGKVNMKDWSRLYDHLCETNPLW